MNKSLAAFAVVFLLGGISACGGSADNEQGETNLGSSESSPSSISWVAPTTNTNGSSLSNLDSYRFYYGAQADTLELAFEISASSSMLNTVNGRTTLELDALDTIDKANLLQLTASNSTHYYAISAVNDANIESPLSVVAQY